MPGSSQYGGDRLPGPSILFCTPKGVANRPHLDLDWLGEIHTLGFEPDYTELSTELTWERIRRYNVLVLYGALPQEQTVPAGGYLDLTGFSRWTGSDR